MDYIPKHIKNVMIESYERHFSASPKLLVRSSGRMELLGNHTDHQGGKVLVAAINLFLYAACSPRDDLFIHFMSEGFDPVTIDLNDLSIHSEEYATTASLLRGIAARLKALDKCIGGMNIYVKTEVPPGSGVSSSAGFEMLIVEILNQLFNKGNIDPLTRAMIGQYAENHYFNKPSGLLDQMGVSLGGINYINFYTTNPLIYQTMDFPFPNLKFMLINTGGSHANLTNQYQSIRLEMEEVAHSFGKTRLADVDASWWERTPPHLGLSPRAHRRAHHYFNENIRVESAKQAIQNQDIDLFLSMINASGRSSETYLENITFTEDHDQLLKNALLYVQDAPVPCAYRVHGGGFAGTMLVIVEQKHFLSMHTYLLTYFSQHDIMDVFPVRYPIISEFLS